VRAHRARRELSKAELSHLVSLYDEEVSAIDAHVGSLLDEIDAAGLRAETLVVFTSDHGEELRDHGFYFFHSFSVSRSVLRVPLVMRLPGVLPEGESRSELVQAIDIAPTVLSLLGFEAPESMEGVDLSGLARGVGTHPIPSPVAFAELGPEIHALQTARWKYVYNPEHYSSPGTAKKSGSGYFGFFRIASEELYDLVADPGEHHDVASEKPALVAEMRERMLAWLETGEDVRATIRIPSESREELRALGYLD
jgi:arylsulfatase A-like enzyme